MKNWNQEFRQKIIALTLENAWWTNYGDVIKPEFFENAAEITIVSCITKFNKDYKRTPTLDEVEVLISKINLKDEIKAEALETARTIYAGAQVWDLSFARDEVLEFARIQALKLAMLEAIDRIEDNDIDGIDRSISEALETGSIQDTGFRLVRDVDSWLSAIAYEEKIPTGIFHADVMLNGGASRGEVGVIIAPPNVGKSMTLVNIGFGASGIISRSNVSHGTLEITPEVLAKRYAARTAFGWYTKAISTEEYKAKFISQANRLLYGDIDIFGAPPGTVSCDDFRRHLDRLDRQGFSVDCLIIDYADEMKMPKGENSFERHGENYRQLKQLAREYNIVIWTASQSNRSSLRKLTIDLDDIAESFQKAARADIVLAWCQTPEEEDEHEMRFFCAKNRDGLKHWYTRCKVHDDSHAIISQEILWGSDLVKEQSDKRKTNSRG